MYEVKNNSACANISPYVRNARKCIQCVLSSQCVEVTAVLFLAFFKQMFDKEIKGFVYSLEGSSQTHRMQLPKDGKTPRKYS